MALALGGTVARTGSAEFGRTDAGGGRRRPDALPRAAARAAGVDVAQRRGVRGAGRLHRRGAHDRHPGRGVRGPRPPAGRRAVPPRGAAHRARPGGARALPLRGRRPRADLDDDATSSTSRSSAIRAQVGDKRVICGLSGGVDSAVAAALVHRAVGDQLTCVFVDHGLLREGEAEQVERDFVAATGVRLKVADARSGSSTRSPASPTRRRSARSSAASSSGSSRRRRARWWPRPARTASRSTSWCRARSTPTWWSPAAAPAPPTSSPTTTWAACRTTCSSRWSSRCGRCSRTRCARSGSSWGCPRRSCGGSRSPARAWASGSSAR